jgi:hypothetical protein
LNLSVFTSSTPTVRADIWYRAAFVGGRLLSVAAATASAATTEQDGEHDQYDDDCHGDCNPCSPVAYLGFHHDTSRSSDGS